MDFVHDSEVKIKIGSSGADPRAAPKTDPNTERRGGASAGPRRPEAGEAVVRFIVRSTLAEIAAKLLAGSRSPTRRP